MSRRAHRLLWAAIAAALAGRVALAFATYGLGFDMDSFHIVRAALASDLLDVYGSANSGEFNRWPYPPAFFAWIGVSGFLESVSGLSYHGFVQLPQIAADGALAWLVQDYLGRRGASERLRLAAATLVLLGPSFWIVSGYQGQIDQVAILPAVLALWLWDRSPSGPRRAIACGLLVGLGAALKVVPGLMIFALLPTVASRREALALAGAAVSVPLVLFTPFLLADLDAVVETFRRHRTLPGFGGISLLVQPELASAWLEGSGDPLSRVSNFLLDHGTILVACAMAPVVGLVVLRRPPALAGAVLLFSALLVLNPSFEFHFIAYALPFALMAGFVWQVAALQLALFLPMAMFYWEPDLAPVGVYVAIMIAVWCAAAAAVGRYAFRLAAG